MRKSRELHPGDVFEIKTSSGSGFFQYIRSDSLMGELVRVFPGTHDSLPDLTGIASQDEQFFAFFPVSAAESRRMVTFIGNASLPTRLVDDFPVLRAPGGVDPVSKRVLNWWLWDGVRSWRVDELTDAQKELSIKGVISAALLDHRIVTGWKPRDFG